MSFIVLEQLQIEPQNKFENIVVTSLPENFRVTDLIMDRLANLRQNLQEKLQTKNRVCTT